MLRIVDNRISLRHAEGKADGLQQPEGSSPRESTKNWGLRRPGFFFLLPRKIGVPTLEYRSQFAVEGLDPRLEQQVSALA